MESFISQLTIRAIDAAILAGRKIVEIYNSEYSTVLKQDKSPLTTADTEAHNCIINKLTSLEIPVLSEEGNSIPWHIRKHWDYFWLIDPLDGTKEFINRNGEFTVNIALIASHVPIIGVIYVPVSGILYFGNPEIGSWKKSFFDSPAFNESFLLSSLIESSIKLPQINSNSPVTVLASRSHQTPDTGKFIQKIQLANPGCKMLSAGSSLKFCLLAEGKAHYYPRFSPTMEWDTAAGHAIAQFSGIEIKSWPDMQPLVYNKESLVNPWFIAHWQALPDFAE